MWRGVKNTLQMLVYSKEYAFPGLFSNLYDTHFIKEYPTHTTLCTSCHTVIYLLRTYLGGLKTMNFNHFWTLKPPIRMTIFQKL